MVADFRKRFLVCLGLTVPVLSLSPMIQMALGQTGRWRFAGDMYMLALISSIIYFYGGWPFLTGLKQELAARNPGMMTLIGVAIKETRYRSAISLTFSYRGFIHTTSCFHQNTVMPQNL
jgi:P-type Cu2+ transporter